MNRVDDKVEQDMTRGIETSDNMDDPRLLAAVQEYLAAAETGRRPNRQEFVARHPDIALELSTCLQGLAFVNSAVAEVNAKSEPAGAGHDELLGGQPLGDFRLLREIGRGGMGVVYEATQLSLGRRVALKILPMAAALDARHLQRFHNEAQAAAQLHHTNIVPVYAVGCERSVHYYAMQLIDGQSLSDVIETLCAVRAQMTGPGNSGATTPAMSNMLASSTSPSARVSRFDQSRTGLGAGADPGVAQTHSAVNLTTLHSDKRNVYFRAVAKLGVQAAEGLFHAHQQGVVHRDIKPANLLLDAQGILWITDFGLAQMYADNGLTQTGDVLGTFRYMSPEQASGRAVVLDQRTDIYSLGITLYELLTLERALPGKTREELMHQIANVDPRSPRSIDRKIPVELENIIGRATAKDPAERYPTARALADDLQRFLDDKPVLARPPSLANKAVKWTRRHRAVAMAAGAILLVVSVGSTASSVLIAREQSKTKAAYLGEQRRALEATEQRKRAEGSSSQAREAVDFLTSMAINELPTDPKFFQVRWQMLETSLAYYQKFLDEEKGNPSVSAQLTAAQAQVSSVLAELAAVDQMLRTNFAIRLLPYRDVIEDLGLTQAQLAGCKTLLAQINSDAPDSQSEGTPLTSQQIRESALNDAAAHDTALAKILSPVQLKRLQEISRQIRGAFAFSDADVAGALALTPTQKNAVRSACAEFHNRRHHGPPQFGGEQERSDMAATVQQILAQLTAHQTEVWNTLVGEPYNGYALPYEFWFSPQPPGRRGPGEGPDEHRGGPPDGPGRRPDGPGRGPGPRPDGPPGLEDGPGGPDRNFNGPQGGPRRGPDGDGDGFGTGRDGPSRPPAQPGRQRGAGQGGGGPGRPDGESPPN